MISNADLVDEGKASAAGLVNRRRALAALFLAAAGAASTAQAAQERALPFGMRRGFNLPDQAPARADRPVKTAHLARLREIGMTHVRLPITGEYFMGDFSGPATIGNAMGDLEGALDRLLKLGYCVTVDMHAGGSFSDRLRRSPESAYSALSRSWSRLADRLAHWPADSVFVELLNEPATSDEIWRELAERLTRELRVRLPGTTVIVGAAPYQRVEALARWRPLADSNVVYAFHYYDPMIFTHQGAEWDEGSPYARMANVPFPIEVGDVRLVRMAEAAAARGDAAVAGRLREAIKTAWTPATVMEQFSALGAWGAAHSVPVLLNEFGVLRFKAPRRDRLAWIRAVRLAAEANGFGWAHWDFQDGFGFIDEDGRMDEPLLNALLSNVGEGR